MRREVTLAIMLLISVIMSALRTGIIKAQMKSYRDKIYKKSQNLKNKFTSQLNQLEHQFTQLQVQQIELIKAIAQLSRITANIANRQ